MFGKKRVTGLALEQGRIVAAEVESRGGRYALSRAAEWAFPDGLSWQEPRELGERLGEWLREEGFGLRAVVGLPARWLVTATHQVPPVEEGALPDLLRLAAERAFSLPAEDMVYDHASAPPAGEAGPALLVGATRDRMEAVASAAEAAGLKLGAVTSTGAVLALASADGADTVTAHLGPEGLEGARVTDGRVRSLRHVPPPSSDRARSGAALQLAIRSVLTGAEPASGDGPERVDLYDAVGLGPDVVRHAGAALGVEFTRDPSPSVQDLDAAETGPARAAPAAALAVGGFERDRLPFDLTEPRLARRRDGRWRRWGLRAVLAVAALVALAAGVLLDRAARRREIAELEQKLEELEPSIKAAENVVETVETARGWYDRRPALLDCLVSITEAFPEEGSLWATSLALREDMRGVLSGKSAGERAVLDVLDGMKASGRFDEVRLLYLRETRGGAGESAFAIDFTHGGTDRS